MNTMKTETKETPEELLAVFDSLPNNEKTAFMAWFAGGKTLLTKYGTNEHVFFGKAECEWVGFDDFWLKKLPSLGWVTVEEYERFIAKGMIGQPESVTYRILATGKGYKVREAYWDRLRGKSKLDGEY